MLAAPVVAITNYSIPLMNNLDVFKMHLYFYTVSVIMLVLLIVFFFNMFLVYFNIMTVIKFND